MHIPISTYRLQLNYQFTFAQAEKILPYLYRLGITDVYISPILQAQFNSLHCYDVIDHHNINTELGGEAGFKQFTQRLHDFNMNLIVDIVPNHMAATSQNKYWMDVIKHRKKSKYAYMFDVNWDTSSDEPLSYRRFFDVNELVCLRAEDPRVFAHTHAFMLKWVQEGYIQGLRVDHVDGLRDPLGYLRDLAQYTKRHLSTSHVMSRCGAVQVSAKTVEPAQTVCYLVIEKMLALNESLPKEWPISGTTGYDFMSQLNQVFVHPDGLDSLIKTYATLTQSNRNIQTVTTDSALALMHTSFKNEFNRLLKTLHNSIGGCLLDLEDLLLQCFAKLRRYRFYPNDAVKDRDISTTIRAICKSIVTKNIEQHRQLVLLTDVMLLNFSPLTNDIEKQVWKKWHNDWEVFSGPLLAKSFEDTACYAYSPLMSLNEVGMGPEYYSTAGQLDVFHAYNSMKHHDWPHGINATSTHDTKRSEDVRARLNVLTELSHEWRVGLKRWLRSNKPKKTPLVHTLAPDTVDELFIYQTLLGVWPVQREIAVAKQKAFKARLSLYLTKAMRERKCNSCWDNPNVEYEAATQQFLTLLLKDADFLHDFLQFQHKIAFYGMYNSLMQLVLKTTSPGVADFYQGNETWQFDLVDPDNRHAVDFTSLSQLASDAPLATLLPHWHTGHIKFNLTRHLLHLRQTYKLIFMSGEYIPLTVEGPHAKHLLAFARKYKHEWIIVLTTRWFSQYLDVDQTWSSERFAVTDRILLPRVLHDFRSLLACSFSMRFGKFLSVQQALYDLPFNIISAHTGL